MANTREAFEKVFRETVVPAIMEEVRATNLASNAVEWIEKVCAIELELSPPSIHDPVNWDATGETGG